MDRLPKEKVAELGNRLFDEKVNPLVQQRDPLEHVAIDVVSGDFEVGVDCHVITDNLLERHPAAQIYTRLVGSRVSVQFGFRNVSILCP